MRDEEPANAHEEFLATLPASGMFTTNARSVQGMRQRWAALQRVRRPSPDSLGMLVITGVLVGLGLGLVVAGFLGLGR